MRTTFIDKRDGDGLCTENAGEAFWWLMEKRPRESTHRSRDYALLADACVRPITPEVGLIADTYQFLVLRTAGEVH